MSQCFGQGAETGTARKVRLTCFRVLKRQHEVDPLLVAGGAWTSSRGSASSARSALVAIAYVQPFYMDRQARIPHRAKRDRACRSEERRVGKSVSVRVDLGGRRIIKKKTVRQTTTEEPRTPHKIADT